MKTIIEDPTSLFPAKAQAQMITESGLPPDEVRAQLKKVLSALIGDSRKSYTYDSQGHITEAVLNYGLFRGNVSRTYTYNDHGDVAEERTTFHQKLLRPPRELRFIRTRTATSYPISRPPNGLPNLTYPEPSEVHYTYQYDSVGNWIDKTVTHGKGSTFTTHRELTYY